MGTGQQITSVRMVLKATRQAMFGLGVAVSVGEPELLRLPLRDALINSITIGNAKLLPYGIRITDELSDAVAFCDADAERVAIPLGESEPLLVALRDAQRHRQCLPLADLFPHKDGIIDCVGGRHCLEKREPER
jgi:hypothetical protein